MSRAIGMGPALAAALLAWTGAAAAEPGQSCQPDLDKLAGWSGIWVAERMQADLNGRELPGEEPYALRAKLIGLDAPWNENGWARFEAGPGPPTGAGPQRQFGFPAMMSSPAPFTIVVAREQTVMVSEYRDVRYIFTDGRGHIPEEERWPTLWGDSTGCWEGETLVIDTVSAKYSPDVSMIAPPFSDNARFTERMRLVAPGRIESEITVEDPETLERTWTVHMAYEQVPSLDRLVHEGDALDNNRIVAGPNGLTIAPTEEAPDPPERVTRQAARLSPGEMDRVVGVYGCKPVPRSSSPSSDGGRGCSTGSIPCNRSCSRSILLANSTIFRACTTECSVSPSVPMER